MTNARSLELDALKAAQLEMGRPGWGTVALVIGVGTALVGLTWAGVSGQLAPWLGVPLLAWVYYAAYTPLHEAVHRNLSAGVRRWRWLDDAAGTLCGTILGVSYTLHRAEHFTHHRHTNQSGADPDKVFGEGLGGLLSGTLRIVPNQYRWFLREQWPKLPTATRNRVLVETALIVASRALPALAGFGSEVLLWSILPNVLGIVITALLFAWIVHQPAEDTSRWGSTASFHITGLLRWPVTLLWLWQNYHAIHHLFPRVPFYRYHAVFERIEPTLDAFGAPVHRLGRGSAAPAVVGS